MLGKVPGPEFTVVMRRPPQRLIRSFACIGPMTFCNEEGGLLCNDISF